MLPTNMKCFLCVFLAIAVNYAVNCDKTVFCYYGSWATYRYGLGKFDVENINPDLCTHLVYTFAGINNEGTVISLDPYLDLPDNWGRDNFAKFNALKQSYSHLKTLLAVGGWNEGSAKYSVMAASPALRKNFIDSALKMIKDHGFDGIDLDWEYPNRRDTVHGEADIDNYTQLLKELREEFDKYGLLVAAAVAAVKDAASLSYDIPAISRYLHSVNIMTYDFHGSWDPVTGHNSGLHQGEGDEGTAPESLYTVDQALDYWISEGCPPEKITMGIPFYGRTFTLSDANVHSVGAPAIGAGISGPYTATSGYVGYNEFCNMLETESWTQHYDSLAKVPYAFKDNNWVSYENVQSVIAKVEYAKKLGIAGVMVWSIETDDFSNVCGEGTYPLLRAINRTLNEETLSTESPVTDSTVLSTTLGSESATEAVTTSNSPASTTNVGTETSTAGSVTEGTTSSTTANFPSTTTEITTTSESNTSTTTTPSLPTDSPVQICKQEGFAPNPKDCSTFYMCVRNAKGDLDPVLFSCPLTLYWDQRNLNCNYAYLVDCSSN